MPITMIDMDHVLEQEAAFADAQYEKYEHDLDINEKNFRHFADPSDFTNWQARMGEQLGDVSGKRLLDLGCGVGKHSVFFAKLGADVTAIDISPRGIENLKRRAAHNNVDVDARLMACPTTLPDHSFDLIFGVGIVHHVGLDECLNEVRRLLKPGGRAVFFEPMGNSRSVEAAKKWLHDRFANRLDLEPITDHETVLNWSDVKKYRKNFRSVTMYPYELMYRVRKFFPSPLWNVFWVTDHHLLKWVTPLSYFAGSMVLTLETESD